VTSLLPALSGDDPSAGGCESQDLEDRRDRGAEQPARRAEGQVNGMLLLTATVIILDAVLTKATLSETLLSGSGKRAGTAYSWIPQKGVQWYRQPDAALN
jgi:hypothetical protein